ncbi:MAG TPA: CRISPR-associated endonuclease Cas2 [Methylococcus sp.]|nr:CRISPR-associated endonuclease Cas2 [Methylococcus sp.]
MPIDAPRLYLVCYDIADPKRLSRVHRYLRRLGMPVQYSVFTVLLSPRRRPRLLQALSKYIDPREDDVRLYPLSEHMERVTLGRQILPDGVFLVGGKPAAAFHQFEAGQ